MNFGKLLKQYNLRANKVKKKSELKDEHDLLIMDGKNDGEKLKLSADSEGGKYIESNGNVKSLWVLAADIAEYKNQNHPIRPDKDLDRY